MHAQPKMSRDVEQSFQSIHLNFSPIALSRVLVALPITPLSLTTSLADMPTLERGSPPVFRRTLFITGAVRGLSTLPCREFSLSLLTMRRAWPAVKRALSVGGEPESEDLGLRRRGGRDADRGPTEEARFTAELIRIASDRSDFHSLSSNEFSVLSGGVWSDQDAFWTCCNEDRFATLPISISRNGELSVSEDDKFVIWGGGGDPSDFFVKKPVWNRLFFGRMSIEGSGGVGIGEELLESDEDAPASRRGGTSN